MLSTPLKVHARLTIMLVTGIILAPAAIATPAVQDLIDLKTVINAAASAIGAADNPNKGWGISLLGGGSQMGTADLVNNITTTILRSKWQLDTNKTSWLLPTNLTNAIDPNNTTGTPTLPLTASLILTSTLPTTTPTLANVTTDLSTPYIDYVDSIPDLSTSLTSLGRAYHREFNSPVHDAIAALQESMSTLQSAMLQSDLIESAAVLRTIRADSSLEDAEQAWSRLLNLPGSMGDSSGDTGDVGITKREANSRRPPPAEGRYYSHKDLWGRNEARARQSTEERPGQSAELARVGRPFVV